MTKFIKSYVQFTCCTQDVEQYQQWLTLDKFNCTDDIIPRSYDSSDSAENSFASGWTSPEAPYLFFAALGITLCFLCAFFCGDSCLVLLEKVKSEVQKV